MANERMCSETGQLMSQWSGASKVSVNGGTTQMANWKQFQCKGTGNKSIRQVWKQVQCEGGINHLANERNCSVNKDQKSMGKGSNFNV
jgi:hypothetical protein